MERLLPSHVWIVAPVMYQNARANLEREFPENIANQFDYIIFAIDDQKSENGQEVIPGIGGSIYDRLGLGGEDQKNNYIPDLVKLRRHLYGITSRH